MNYSKNKTGKSEIPVQKIKCRCGCGKYLRPNLVREQMPDEKAVFGTREGKVLKIAGYGYGNNNKFDSLRCGFRWAVKNA
jgi:hypothetical protein